MRSRSFILVSSVLAAIALAVLFWYRPKQATRPEAQTTAEVVENASKREAGPDQSATIIHAHNLLLRKGPDFRVYVRWLEGRLARTRRDVNPSFDRPESFNLDVHSGVIRANIGDIGHYVNSALSDAPLKNVKILADGANLKLTGTLHKLIPVPIEVIAAVSAEPDDRVRVHILKINVLKVPIKALLGALHVSAADLVRSNLAGVEITGNDIVLDTQKLLPPPRIRGRLTEVRVDSPDIEAVFGKAAEEVERVQLWRNFFSLKNGTIDFGNLTMHPVNIIMVDISTNPWFDLDLVNYRDQLGSGYTRITADSGLQMFIPDRRDVQAKPESPADSIQWFKHRNIPPPPQIVSSARR
ncbi:MAG TPA: hypothetical protein VH369_22250 [Bryobacteraceae bacterium]|jgi:hypothetical protein